METVMPPDPLPRNDPAWDTAFQRVECYLLAHGFANRIALTALTTRIVADAHAVAERNPGAAPVTVAMKEANAVMARWFTGILGPDIRLSQRLSVRGRLALALTDAPARWPEHFLTERPPPPELVAEMRAVYLENGPALQLSTMVAKPLQFDPLSPDMAHGPPSRWTVMRLAAGWGLVLGLVGLLCASAL
jgi:hypothetical protein